MRRKHKRLLPAGTYGTEAELCDEFIAAARADGFAAHPETSGYDVLLCCRQTGEQVGIQAKLRDSMEVLYQSLAGGSGGAGPAVHAVLVTSTSHHFELVASHLKLLVFTAKDLMPKRLGAIRDRVRYAQRWQHSEPAWMPPGEVHIPAGVPGPASVTKWKVAAVRLCIVLRRRGWLTSQDFKRAGVSMAWWTQGNLGHRVLVPGPIYGRWVAGEAELPDDRYPEIAAMLEVAALEERLRLSA